MMFRPLHDRVLVRRVDAEDRSAGGIIIPDTAKEKPTRGEVVATGPGVRDHNGELVPPSVQPGDAILFGKWSGSEIDLDGEDLLVMRETDILAVLEEESRPQMQAA